MLLSNLNLLATAPGGVARLRELILTLAVQGKLVPQDPSDEPASELLRKIRVEKDRLIAAGKIKRDKPLAGIAEEERPFGLPQGWEWARCDDYFLELCTGPFGSMIHQEDYVRDGVPLINPSHMVGGRIVHDPRVTLKPADVERLSAYALSAGDMVLARRGEVGRYAYVTDREHGWLCGTGSFFVRLHSLCDRDYLGLIFSDARFREHLQGESVGTTMTNLNQRILLNALLALPPLAEQSRIVTRVEELMRLCDALEAKGQLEATQHAQLVSTLLATLTDSETPVQLADNWHRIATHFDLLLDRPDAVDALEQTILQLAVRGLLVPQDPQDEPASELLKKIRRAEKDKLIAEGKIKRDKPLPPIAEDEQPFALPQGWEWVRLNSLLQKIGAGSTPLGGREVYVPSGVKFLRSQNVWDDGLRLHGVAFIKPETHAKMSGTVVVANDLLFNITGASIGRCAVVPSDFDEANVSQHVTIVRTVLPALNAFLHKVLVSRHVQQAVMDVQVGVSREGLSIAKLGQFLIPVPPLAEQSRIVTRVAQLRPLCADLRQRLSASQSTQAHLAEALVQDVA